MLISLIVWIYITFICLTWGKLLISLLTKKTALAENIHGSIICMTGLAGISTFALFLSLFMPLNGKAQGLILLPSVYYCLKKENRHAVLSHISRLLNNFSVSASCLWLSSVFMVLIISVYNIGHPDTMAYHARSILLLEKYQPVPGIANLVKELGLVSAWFASLAIFKLDMPAFDHIIFLNGAVLCWFLTFVINKITQAQQKWAWLLLLIFTFLSYTQIRLTASSPSPDFIVTLYTWTAIYLFITRATRGPVDDYREKQLWLTLIAICCFTALLIKISAIVILLLIPAAIFFTKGIHRVKTLLHYGGWGLLTLTPLFIRNIISSGYLLYPLPYPDLFNSDWKMTPLAIRLFGRSIIGFARLAISAVSGKVPDHLSFFYWVPTWWKNLDKISALLILSIILGMILYLRRLFSRWQKKLPYTALDQQRLSVLLIVLLGSLTWFQEAPSPRFGTGMLIPLCYFLLDGRSNRSISAKQWPPFFQRLVTSAGLLRTLTWSLTTAILCFSVYRCIYFFTPVMLITPGGIDKEGYSPIDCSTFRADLQLNTIEIHERIQCSCSNEEFGARPIPRGHTVSDGFQCAK